MATGRMGGGLVYSVTVARQGYQNAALRNQQD